MVKYEFIPNHSKYDSLILKDYCKAFNHMSNVTKAIGKLIKITTKMMKILKSQVEN